jgi:speckle-type POZ protein
MAQLFGHMKETTTSHVRIDDMEPRVFRAMLHFVYTDSLPEMDSGGDAPALAQHLLVAADRYGMERLKLICEYRLCDYINTGTAATTLELAEQYGFRGLKVACFKFLKTPGNLKAIMDSDEFQRLTTRCPSLLSELLANVAP